VLYRMRIRIAVATLLGAYAGLAVVLAGTMAVLGGSR